MAKRDVVRQGTCETGHCVAEGVLQLSAVESAAAHYPVLPRAKARSTYWKQQGEIGPKKKVSGFAIWVPLGHHR